MIQPPHPQQTLHPQQPAPQYPAWPPGGWDQPPAGTDWMSPARHGPPEHEPFAPKPGTNAFAIVALIHGIIGGALLGIIFGLIALRQIRRRGEDGRGLAIAGLIMSGMWILLLAVLVAAALIVGPTTTAHSDPSTGTVATGTATTGTGTTGGDVSIDSLRVGDCVDNLPDSTTLVSLPAVPCAQAHEGEVFAVLDLPNGPFPGLDAVRTTVRTACSAQLDGYASDAGDPDIDMSIIFPQQQNWDVGDRHVVCIATRSNGATATGSIKGT